MRKESFSFDNVCIPPDKQSGRHSQSTWELSAITIGSGEKIIGDSASLIREGEIILIPPGIEHHWKFDGKKTDQNGCISNITVTFSTSMLDSIKNIFPETDPGIDRLLSLNDAVEFPEEQAEKIMDILFQMTTELPIMRIPLFLELVIQLSLIDETCIVYHGDHRSRSEKKLEKLRIYCKCNFDRDITLETAAGYMKMNKSSFCKFVKRMTGNTFTHFLNKIRLNHSIHLLRNSDSSISEIAYQCGFSCVAYFNKLFKAEYGVSPTHYRKITAGKAHLITNESFDDSQ